MPQIGFTEPQPRTAPADKEKKVYEAIPAGTYNAEVVSLKYQKVNKEICYWKKHDDEIVFEFVITDEDSPYNKRRFWADVQAIICDESWCKLRLWLQEIIGVNSLGDGFVFDTDDLSDYVGLPCRIRVNQYWSKAKGVYQNGIDDVLAASKSQFKSLLKEDEEPF